jgi:dTDP-4-amino-4,6-dideoxygalactose transaminase
LDPPPSSWWLKALRASIHRRDFDEGGELNDWYALYQEAEAGGSCTPCAMSGLSAAILYSCVDYTAIARRRRENYLALAAGLSSIPWRPELPAGVVPLGFPVRLRNRDRVKRALCEQGIYPPVHWPIAGVVPQCFSESHRLAGGMMTLPCDQRLDASDMERIAKAVAAAI